MNTKSLLLAVIALTLSACAPEAVRVTLTPATAEIEAVLLEADARWEKAGVAADRITIGEGGAPVTVKDLGWAEEGPVLGVTVGRKRGREFIGVRRMELAALDLPEVIHEMGHALGIAVGRVHPFEETGECDPEITERPNMCAIDAGALITEKDLTEACAVGACTHFTPEVY